MSSLIIIMTSWKSDLPPGSTQFPMQRLKIAIQQQCTWGYTRGGVWPLKSENITNPRRKFWHRPSLAPFVQKRDEFSPKITLSRPSPCAITQGLGLPPVLRVGGIEGGWGGGGGGSAALWQIVRYMRLDISAVIPRQFFIREDFGEKCRDFARWQLDRTAPSLEGKRPNCPLPFKVSRHSTRFLHAWMQVAAYFCYCSWPGAVPVYSSPSGWCSAGSVCVCVCLLWERACRGFGVLLFFFSLTQGNTGWSYNLVHYRIYVLFLKPTAKDGRLCLTV